MSDRLRIVLRSLIVGTAFGFVLVRSEAVSWYRITEMFRFQSFHMYGIIGSAVLVGAASLWAIRRFGPRDHEGRVIRPAPKESRGWNTRYWARGYRIRPRGGGFSERVRGRSMHSSAQDRAF